MPTRYLSTFLNYEKDLSRLSSRQLHLARVRCVLSKLGSPQKSLKVIHIAGSKGKGSTAAFIAGILQHAGYKVGLYTSPHLYDVRERFRILDKVAQRQNLQTSEVFPDCISRQMFSSLIKRIRPTLEAGRHHSVFGDLTYFEVLTIAAFCYFQDEKVDFAVLETGLGGRLDATNVCSSLVAAITPISLEHTQQLGTTLRKIAAEKAGIIKKGCAVVSAVQAAEVLPVIESRCRRFGIVPMIVGKDFTSKNSDGDFKISLLGRHQRMNATVALGVVDALRCQGFVIKPSAVKKGLATTFWPLRFEMMSRQPMIILDAAHNPESCQRLAETIQEKFPKRKVNVIFGCSNDKDIQGMTRCLLPIAQQVILTRVEHPRAKVWTKQDVQKYFFGQNVCIAQSMRKACRLALESFDLRGVIVVTGSLFVAAQARKILGKLL